MRTSAPSITKQPASWLEEVVLFQWQYEKKVEVVAMDIIPGPHDVAAKPQHWEQNHDMPWFCNMLWL
jgi:hypothetical protein